VYSSLSPGGLCLKNGSCPKSHAVAPKVNGGEKDDEPSPEGGSARILALIFFSIAILSGFIVILCCLALYQTDPIFAMALSLPTSIVCTIAAIIILKKEKNTRRNTENTYNNRSNTNCFHTIHTAITRGKDSIRQLFFKNAGTPKSNEGIYGKNKSKECNKEQKPANYFRHTTPPREK
jgi:hypothetical protein